jgi:hypothetical protein
MGLIVNTYTFTPSRMVVDAGKTGTGRLVINYNTRNDILNVDWSGRMGTAAPSQCWVNITDFNNYECTFEVDATRAEDRELNTVEITAEITYQDGLNVETYTESFGCPITVMDKLDIDIPGGLPGDTGNTGNTGTTGNTSGSTTGGTTGDTTGDTITINLSSNPTKMIFDKVAAQGISINSNVEVEDWSWEDSSSFYITKLSESSTSLGLQIYPKAVTSVLTKNNFLTVTATSGSTTATINVPITIWGYGAFPIWEDYFFTFPEEYGERVKYKIIDGKTKEELYSGLAQQLPTQYGVEINLSKMVRNHLTNHFPELIDGAMNYDEDGYGRWINILVDNVNIAAMLFYNSWGYEPKPNGYTLSAPIRNIIDRKQWFVCSIFNDNTNLPTVRYQLSKSGTDPINRTSLIATNGQKIIVDRYLSEYNDYNQIQVDNATYKIIDGCYEYCLYYKNAFGGWDSLLVGGNTTKTDKINSQYYTKVFNNKTYQFGKTKYLNVISPSYTLYTDWFNDDEQSRLYHLLESTEVYLHNLNTNKLEPVNIANTDCVYKTFTNNGKKKWYNTINVEVAQDKIRQ